MVQNAEYYINQKITKLVITVPAYFNDSQRKLTKQAAELVGLKVLRIISEPVASALAYGFDKNKKINDIIFVFDLSGKNLDISILSVKEDKNNRNYFKVLGRTTQLGGEDFDNKLVEYFLNKINRLYNENDWKELNGNKQLIKKLKIHCERIKRLLSKEEKAVLNIPNFFKNIDIIEEVTRKEFEDLCEPLFQKIKKCIDEALSHTKLTKNDIQEIILIGGSTRIPKVQEIVGDYFPELKKKNKINKKINADEAVAVGATISAEKILNSKDKSISNIIMFDKIPFSLGINVENNSEEQKMRDEGEIMDVIIKRGALIPYMGSKTYSTVYDNQTGMMFDIYEGDNNFVKYNHLLTKCIITGLRKRPKGETKVDVTFEININGSLTVIAEEKNNGKKIELTIKDYDISLDPEKIERLKEKNKRILERMKKNYLSNIDYNNLRDTLKNYNDAYNDAYKRYIENEDDDEDDDDDYYYDFICYKIVFNNILEVFIDSFYYKTYVDNETLFEKFYLYIKQLFLSYFETLTLDIERQDRENIVSKIKKYIDFFIDKSSDYLSSLIEIFLGLERTLQIIFYRIIIYVMQKLNEIGENYILSNKKFCKYYSLNYFELAKTYYEKYLSKINIVLLRTYDLNNLNEQKKNMKHLLKILILVQLFYVLLLLKVVIYLMSN